MIKRFRRRLRPIAGIAVAGLLLQTGGCMIDAQPLITGIANDLIASVVFGVFNVAPRF